MFTQKNTKAKNFIVFVVEKPISSPNLNGIQTLSSILYTAISLGFWCCFPGKH